MEEAGLDLCASMCGEGADSYYHGDEIEVCINADSLTR